MVLGSAGRTCPGASRLFLSGGCGAAILSIDDFWPTVVFDAKFDGKQGVRFGSRPAASRLAKKIRVKPNLSKLAWGNF